jgi:Tfp pilus assembly protein PilV
MRAFRHNITTRLRDLRRRQDGAVLMEVIFSTLVVALASAAVLKGVEGSVLTASKNRERSVAAQLAEQDQERMRSFKATSLDGYSETRTVVVRGISYTVQSSTQWVYDSSGTKSCTSDTSQASYLKLMSTVTPAFAATAGNKPVPVSATSLLTPPNGTFSTDKGSIAVMLVDRNGAPRPNLTVNLTGGSVSESDATNSSGCANFYYVPVGSPPTAYNVTVAAPGLVDRDGNATISKSVGVVGGASTLTTIELDIPVKINVAFETKVGANPVVAARGQYATLQSSGLASPGYLRQSLATFPTTDNTFTWNSMYPFTSGYAAYGGNCAKNDPTQWVTGYTANAIAVTPGGGGAGGYTITARLPSINIIVKNSAGTILNGAHVTLAQTDSLCTATYSQSTDATGALPKPGYPWGTYSVCADDNNKRTRTLTMNNTTAAGTATTTFTLPSTQGTVNCP